MADDELMQVGCAALWLPDQGVIAAAAAGADEVDRVSESVPWPPDPGAAHAALALSALLALRMAVCRQWRRVQVLMPGPLELAARIRVNAYVPELSLDHQRELQAAHTALEQVFVTNTLPGVMFELQVAAEGLCREFVVTAPGSTNGRVPH